MFSIYGTVNDKHNNFRTYRTMKSNTCQNYYVQVSILIRGVLFIFARCLCLSNIRERCIELT